MDQGKNALLNFINYQSGTDKIYLYDKDQKKPKYQSLINKREQTGVQHFNVWKLLLIIQLIGIITKISMIKIQTKIHKVLIVFDDIIVDMLSKKKCANDYWIIYS